MTSDDLKAWTAFSPTARAHAKRREKPWQQTPIPIEAAGALLRHIGALLRHIGALLRRFRGIAATHRGIAATRPFENNWSIS
jgi:hypothetical protein